MLWRRVGGKLRAMASPTPRSSAVRVLDDFLDEGTWTALWSDFQFMDLHPVTRTSGAWKLDDGVPLGGEAAVIERGAGAAGPALAEGEFDPDAPALDALLEAVLAQLHAAPELVEGLIDEGWDRVSGRPYVYPRGTGLSWHVDDHELYAGAFIYYAHPRWDVHWGGELLLAELPADEALDELPIMAYRFATEAYSAALLERGCGRFIMPKPNRLVLLGGAPHMVAPVRAAAGQQVRASVSGFFLRPDASAADQA